MTAIDIHFHAIPPAFIDAVRRGDLRDIIECDATDQLVFHAPPGAPVEPGLRIRPRIHDTDLILAAMDRRHLDAAAVSTPPEFFMYWAPPDAGERLARLVNDGYAAWARAFPSRLIPLATVPLQDPARACRELHRAISQLGLRGAAICTHVNGTDLDDPQFAPFFALAERLDIPLFLHPQNAGDMSRLADYHLWNIVGFPAETATAASRLILSGTFARHPRLKIILAHGGGFLPYQLGRLDHGWHARATLRETCPEAPSTYLRNIWCDSLVHDPTALAFLVARIGTDRVVLGTDHPFDMGDDDPVASLDRAHLPPDTARKIKAANIADLLKL